MATRVRPTLAPESTLPVDAEGDVVDLAARRSAAALPSGADSSSGSVGVPPFVDDVLTVAEVAEFLRVGRNHVYGLAARNAIPHRRVGKHLRFSRRALLRWLSCGHADAQEGH